jgi:lysophospholipase L1-like esterase
MSGKNKSAYPLYIITGTLLCLMALSLVPNSFSINTFTTRPLDMLADLRQTAPEENIVTDTTQQKVDTPVKDSAQLLHPMEVHDFMTYQGILEYKKPTDSIATRDDGMQKFLVALQELKAGKRKKVRIAYFGDSMIEGDLITSDLRDSLQTFFGGDGVGFVPIASVVSSFRTTISHTFSKNWKDYHYKNNPPADILLGISGHTFLPDGNSWIKYVPVRKPRLDRFDEVAVLYGPSNGNASITINDKPYPLTGGRPVNKLALQQDTSHKGVTIQYDGTAASPLYGVCFESQDGVFVDNYSFRGISGVELSKLSGTLIQETQAEHPYDLVVLHYGANVLFRPELTDYSWYERPMKKVMDSLRNVLPGTSFLIIGTADKSYKKSDKYITAPGVTALLKVQHELAEEHGTAYWNLYAAMGGSGSMTHWVEGDTVLANKDYTHFNRQGAAKVGALLYKAIMDEYKQGVQP